MLPRVFIGSSAEGRRYAELVARELYGIAECNPWYDNVFEVGGETQDSLITALGSSDFSVLVMTADDIRDSRNTVSLVPRDNLVFEAGLSFGMLKPERSFLIPERVKDFRLPSDLLGFTVTHPFEHRTRPTATTLEQALTQIRKRIHELGIRPSRAHSGDADVLADATRRMISAAERHVVLFGRDLSWADRYQDVIRERVNQKVRVEVFTSARGLAETRRNAKTLESAGARIRYCKQNPGIKLTLIDHHDPALSRFMISFKHRLENDDTVAYRFSMHDAKSQEALWLTLVRLYESLKAESQGARKRHAIARIRSR